LSALRPLHRSVTLSYHDATAHWWARENLYVGPSGMNYLPHFVVLYSPFHFLPLPVCEVLWRLCSAATLAGGLWLLTRLLFRSEPERPFFWATVVAMPLCMTSLRNGNANAIFGGVVLLSVAALFAERWWLAVFLMTLATALKPLGIVLLLLAPVVYWQVLWRLPVALAALVVFPFLFASPSYVLAQHMEAWKNLQSCAVVTEHRFADINGVLRTFGTALGPAASKLVRVLAGVGTAALWWWSSRRWRGPMAALYLYALAAGYLMLFNPMNEENSYVILAPALGIWAGYFLFQSKAQGSRALGWAIVAMALSMSLLPNLVRPMFGNHFALFWHPVMTVVFLSMLTGHLARAKPTFEPTANPA
ncbi:MAG TPA: glycosyltransferase family 87 protein, partial [Verrucomicrobiae bacterium]|nr:glycosyltransferase family 87 protein [Verrucomicrobiae bacterium]